MGEEVEKKQEEVQGSRMWWGGERASYSGAE